MNSTPEPAGPRRAKAPLGEAEKASLARTLTLFRMFIVSVLGSVFVYQLDVGYLWLSAILTAAGLALGIVLLVRWFRLRKSRLVLFGTISGLVVTACMLLVTLASAVFFNQVADYQTCVGRALTDQAQRACQVQLEKSLPRPVP
ncbi:hypothetical protein AB0N71_10230 [Pseudarthrobacter enclensis]|uniref:hypothetical protein n=1 Tax=Pseudarthrobacter enclensis TaxID=993070 RepID=UPI003444DEA9